MATTKKTAKKIETPIDERETFVSLQKNFADSEVSVAEKLRTLYELQKADNAIDRIVLLRGELPEEVTSLENEIETLRAKVGRIDEMIEEYQNGIEAAKNEIVELDASIEKYQAQIEGISNSREYDSINKEIENQGLLRQIAEKNIGEARVAIAEKKDVIATLSDKIENREADLKAKRVELESIVESTSKEEEVLQARRDALASKVDARTISAYDRIRASVRNHQAVVGVFGGNACGGCFSTITPQRLVDIASGTKLVICEHCGRILVADSDAEDKQ